MSGEIRQANRTLSARKAAVVAGQAIPGGLTAVTADTVAHLLSGFDLDPDEAFEIFKAAGEQGMNYLRGIVLAGPQAAFALLWLDGLVMGLLIAQAREREATGG